MITVDAGRRAARLEELMQALERHSDPADRELLRSFAPVVYDSLPDAVALGLSLDALTRRMLDYFRFFVREFPPPTQVYRGLPGIHVVVRNPVEADEQRIVHGRILPLETTVVETHTLDAPFIFESLKNYFRRAGLRVFSAIHPMLSVRRQWERIVALGPPQEDGSRESFCHFRIERVDSKERLARIEHEIYSVLKAVFTAVEDFEDMRRVVRELGPKLRDRTPGAGRVEPARGFLDWLLNDNYIFLGTVKYVLGPRRPLRARAGDRHRRLHRPRPAAGGVPRAHGRGRDPPRPQRERPPHRRHRLLQQRDGDLPPRADRRHRDPALGGGRQPAGDDAAPRAPVHGRVHGKGLRGPAAQGEARVDPGQQRRGPEVVRVPRDPRAVQPLPQARALLRQRAQPQGRHRAHRLHDRRRRRGRAFAPRRRLRRPFHRVLAPALLVQGRGGPEARPDGSVRPHRVQQLDGLRRGDPAPVLLRLLAHGAAGGQRRGPPHDRRAGHHLGGPGGRRPRGRPGRARGAPAVPELHPLGEPQRAVPRVDAPRGGAGRHPQPREPRGPPAGRHPAALRGDGHPEAVLAPGARPHPDPPHAAEPRRHRHRRAARPAHPARGAQGVPLPVRDRDHAGADREPGHRRGPLRRRAARPRRGDGDRRRAERPRPPGGPDLARGRAAAHAPEPHAAGPHPLQRGDRERRAAAQQRGGGVAVPLLRRALRPPGHATAARPASPPPTPR